MFGHRRKVAVDDGPHAQRPGAQTTSSAASAHQQEPCEPNCHLTARDITAAAMDPAVSAGCQVTRAPRAQVRKHGRTLGSPRARPSSELTREWRRRGLGQRAARTQRRSAGHQRRRGRRARLVPTAGNEDTPNGHRQPCHDPGSPYHNHKPTGATSSHGVRRLAKPAPRLVGPTGNRLPSPIS